MDIIFLIMWLLGLYGVYLGWKASWILAVIIFFIPPTGLIISVVYLWKKVNLAQSLLDWLNTKGAST
jgi:hypothetical protein